MAEAEGVDVKRRRRKSSSRKKAATWPEYWRGRDFGRHLFIAMGLIGAAYAGTILWETRFASNHYGPTVTGMTESEVRYVLGPPRTVEAGGTLYRYSDKGREVAVRFSPAGRMESISCEPGPEDPPTCPRIMGIGIGSDEYDVLLQLGVPSRETFRGNDKAMYYDGMGLTFQMRLLKVRGLEVREGRSLAGYVTRGLLRMIP